MQSYKASLERGRGKEVRVGRRSNCMPVEFLSSLPLIVEVLDITGSVKQDFEVLGPELADLGEVVNLMEQGLGVREVFKQAVLDEVVLLVAFNPLLQTVLLLGPFVLTPCPLLLLMHEESAAQLGWHLLQYFFQFGLLELAQPF